MLTMMFYILNSITGNIEVGQFRGAEYVQVLLNFGIVIVGIMSVIIIFYINSFLMKQRNREFGLYSILGLEKKHIRYILFWEIFLVGLFSTVVGLITGVVLSKLMFLLFLNILKMDVTIPFTIEWKYIGTTLLLFTAIYFVLILTNGIRMIRYKPIEMLRDNKAGEREPKLNLISALIGATCLDGGYTIAIVVRDPVSAVAYFFIAVLLVIIGTYLLFMSGSIALLKLLKKNKKFYYHRTHFITVSGMMYRMKQNAAGLATICILSTMVLVSLSTSISLYTGIYDTVKERYPVDTHIQYPYSYEELQGDETEAQSLHEVAQQFLDKFSLKKENESGYYMYSEIVKVGETLGNYEYSDPVAFISVYRVTDYETLAGEQAISLDQLGDNEVYLFTANTEYADKLTQMIEAHGYSVKAVYDTVPSTMGVDDYGFMNYDQVMFITQDLETLNEFKNAIPRISNSGDEVTNSLYYHYQFDLAGGEQEDKLQFSQEYQDAAYSMGIHSYSYMYYTSLDDFMYMHGSLFFIGGFLGFVFLLATTIIIYYKQITEGYDDRKRFLIMMKVGMSRQEVKRVIRSQILTVFFLPIIAAIVHILFAFGMIKKMLLLVGLTNVALFIICTICTVIIFTLIYGIVYSATAKAYYRIVNTADNEI